MEEILASIRRIIADDQDSGRAAVESLAVWTAWSLPLPSSR